MPFAETVILNASILTMDEAAPRAEALAIGDGKIIAVGSAKDMAPLTGPDTKVIDAQGNTVLPGFVEAHMHLFPGATGLRLLQLGGVKTHEEMTKKLRSYAADTPEEALLICKGVEYPLFTDSPLSPRQIIDAALPERPVIMIAVDHHTGWGNTVALEHAGILKGIELPTGNEVVLDDAGEATGELREFLAMRPVLALRSSGGREDYGMQGEELPISPTSAQRESDIETLKEGLAYCASFGFTTLHNMDGNFYQMELLREIEDRGELICRMEVPFHLSPSNPVSAVAKAVEMREMYASDRLRSGRLKLFIDGVIDSGTGVLLEDYEGQPGWKGDPLHSAERFKEIVVEADRCGLQISVHAIGDGGIRTVLDSYAAARAANGMRDSRHRIEHLELVHPDDLPRLRELDVIASMQPAHPPLSMDFPADPWLSNVGKDRWPHAFPLGPIREQGVPLVFSSDWPVADINPMRSIKAAMLRPRYSEDCPDNRVTLLEALRYYTYGGAYAGFDEDRIGQFKPGYLADIVIMDADLEHTQVEDLDKTRARMTLSEGRVIWASSVGSP